MHKGRADRQLCEEYTRQPRGGRRCARMLRCIYPSKFNKFILIWPTSFDQYYNTLLCSVGYLISHCQQQKHILLLWSGCGPGRGRWPWCLYWVAKWLLVSRNITSLSFFIYQYSILLHCSPIFSLNIILDSKQEVGPWNIMCFKTYSLHIRYCRVGTYHTSNYIHRCIFNIFMFGSGNAYRVVQPHDTSLVHSDERNQHWCHVWSVHEDEDFRERWSSLLQHRWEPESGRRPSYASSFCPL